MTLYQMTINSSSKSSHSNRILYYRMFYKHFGENSRISRSFEIRTIETFMRKDILVTKWGGCFAAIARLKLRYHIKILRESCSVGKIEISRLNQRLIKKKKKIEKNRMNKKVNFFYESNQLVLFSLSNLVCSRVSLNFPQVLREFC